MILISNYTCGIVLDYIRRRYKICKKEISVQERNE